MFTIGVSITSEPSAAIYNKLTTGAAFGCSTFLKQNKLPLLSIAKSERLLFLFCALMLIDASFNLPNGVLNAIVLILMEAGLVVFTLKYSNFDRSSLSIKLKTFVPDPGRIFSAVSIIVGAPTNCPFSSNSATIAYTVVAT